MELYGIVPPLLFFFYIFDLRLCSCGRITEEKLAQRWKDLGGEVDIDADGRPRRQLPTEINIQVTAPLFTARLYEYGTSEGDKEVPASLDVGIKVELQRPIVFYEQTRSNVYILSNGGIGFDQNSRNYKNNILRTGPALIAPLWNRNDLRKGGQIYFREVTDGRVMERAQSEVRYQYDKNIKPLSVLLVTWVNMQPTGDEKVKADNANTVQAAIISSDNGTFVNFIYKNIGWSQGAEAGFGKGDGQNFYSMPSSGTDGIMFLKDAGNTGIPGEWMFEIDGSKLIRCKPGIKGDTCDNECAESEWGNDCEKCCHCSKGRCNPTSGECAGGNCKQCWNDPPLCNRRDPECKGELAKECGYNAISFSDVDKCGETILRCQCLSGYVGDGFNCTDVNECTKKNVCHEHAKCLNTPGRFYCECKPGYTGNGTICVEIAGGAKELTETATEKTQQAQAIDTTEKGDFADTSPKAESTESALLEFSINTRLPSKSPRPQSNHSAREEVAYVLPKETNSQLKYQLRQPLMIFGKMRTKFTVSSVGVVSLNDVAISNADQDLELAGLRGFAPFFGRIDLRKSPTGKVYVAETSQSDILTDATNTVDQHFRTNGFLAKSVITITFENVTTQNVQRPNTFQLVFIGGSDADGDNMTFVEYVYADLQWSDDAQSMILTDDPTNTIVLPGSGTEGVKQLARLSNIQTPGEWMYRVDLDKVLPCPLSNLLPPYCSIESPPEVPAFPAEVSQQTPRAVDPAVTQVPKLDFEHVDNGEQVTFPAFLTVIPQLITNVENKPTDRVNAATPVIIRPALVTAFPGGAPPSSRHPSGPNIIFGPSQTKNAESGGPVTPKHPTESVKHKISSNERTENVFTGDDEQDQATVTLDVPLLQIFTTTKKSRPPLVSTRSQPKIVTATNVGPSNIDSRRTIAPVLGNVDDQDGLNSPSKLAIIIPTAIVGVWLLLLLIIVVVVCCRRRSARKRLRTKFDPSSYHFRHMPHSSGNTLSRSTDPLSQPAVGVGSSVPKNGGYTNQPHASYEDHLDKAARLSEMTPYGGQSNRTNVYGSYWNVPTANRQQPMNYYNQGFYESCPEISRFTYTGRY